MVFFLHKSVNPNKVKHKFGGNKRLNTGEEFILFLIDYQKGLFKKFVQLFVFI